MKNKTPNPDRELLNRIHQNALMGSEAITALLPKVTSAELKKDLLSQMASYQNFVTDSSKKLSDMNATPNAIPATTKLPAKINIGIGTMLDASSCHIAEMMIEGSVMGVNTAQKQLGRFPEAKTEIVDMANQLIAFEQGSIEKLKGYL